MSPRAGARQGGDTLLHARGGNVLLLSMRNLATLVAYSALYEFEDVIQQVTDADRIDVGNREALEFSRRSYKVLRSVTGSPSLARWAAVKPATVPLEREYDLFFPMFNQVHELYALEVVPNWRERCRFAACFISEVWSNVLPEYLLQLLGRFDHVFLGMRHCVEDVGRIVGRPCSYLPFAVDVMRFSPWPTPVGRGIDVCNIGRRSPITHAALIELAQSRRISYYFDTFARGAGSYARDRTFHVHDPQEHRLLLANLLRRTRYYVANRSLVNKPDFTEGREEVSYRFYEGAAAGTVMIGEPPDSVTFRKQFDWPDAVIQVPFDCAGIAQVLAELGRDPDRLSRISYEGAAQAARRHDWVHRLSAVFEVFGLVNTPAMQERERRLRSLVQPTR